MLEVNLSHPLVRNLAALHAANAEDPMLVDAVEQIYAGALLIEKSLENPMDFVRRSMEFMEKATRGE
jgi:molecular chaperone HtpG